MTVWFEVPGVRVLRADRVYEPESIGDTLLTLPRQPEKPHAPNWTMNGALMILNSKSPATPSWPSGTSREPLNWSRAPLYKQLLLAVIFLVAFLLLDRSSAASQAWAGAPTRYLPVGLALALLLCGGMRYLPLVFISTLLAAVVNYHRPLLSWCGVPGLTVYIAYIGGVIILRGRCRIDPKLGKVRDVARFALILLTAAIPSAGIGTLTLLGDNLISNAAVRDAVFKVEHSACTRQQK
jgi:hypothetical protein